ncbi:MAG: 23S rRNA pseudouridine(1911/1915/1917) synthase RluD [Pseudomonadales bacterium]|nr:23S rRNA pseudouridine(1911/1915/1917) synthase RluD [Pseudomonadales bacterium]
MSQNISLEQQVEDSLAGKRLDQIAATLFSQFSRSRLKGWIQSGELLVDGKVRKPKEKLVGGELLTISAELEVEESWEPNDIELDIVYEDEDLLVINKPAGMVVHPGAGHQQGTVLNGLVYRSDAQATLPRAGIVHRLDKETSGLMVVAKNLEAHTSLVGQLQDKSVHREYEAIVIGEMTGGGMVDQPIARHPTQRTRMAVVHSGKPAVTHYRIIERYRSHTRLSVRLETGRTHQIRVHMTHVQHPLLGDPVYGGRLKLPKGATPELIDELRAFRRQALHAKKLGLQHPRTDEYCEWEVPLPADMLHLLDVLSDDLKKNGPNYD